MYRHSVTTMNIQRTQFNKFYWQSHWIPPYTVRKLWPLQTQASSSSASTYNKYAFSLLSNWCAGRQVRTLGSEFQNTVPKMRVLYMYVSLDISAHAMLMTNLLRSGLGGRTPESLFITSSQNTRVICAFEICTRTDLPPISLCFQMKVFSSWHTWSHSYRVLVVCL